MKRNKKTPTTFKFDSDHVLGSARVSKHRKKIQKKNKKREARKVEEPNPGDANSTDDAVEAVDGPAEVEASNETTKEPSGKVVNKK